jgi:predicted metal-dependent hydrolase
VLLGSKLKIALEASPPFLGGLFLLGNPEETSIICYTVHILSIRGDFLYPAQYIEYLAHFNGDRDYFECHEILEEYWKETTDRSKDSIWVGFILLAVSRYHHRRRNYNGAKRTLEKAIKIFSLHDHEPILLGLNANIFFPMLSNLLVQAETEERYQSITLPISDPALLEACLKECQNKGFNWGQESNLEDESIIHRHKLRDRTNVIEERMEALINKKGNEK